MKILAVGMNYAKHNKELDGTLYKPEEPVIFTKADSALLKDRKPFFVPDSPWNWGMLFMPISSTGVCRI